MFVVRDRVVRESRFTPLRLYGLAEPCGNDALFAGDCAMTLSPLVCTLVSEGAGLTIVGLGSSMVLFSMRATIAGARTFISVTGNELVKL